MTTISCSYRARKLLCRKTIFTAIVLAVFSLGFACQPKVTAQDRLTGRIDSATTSGGSRPSSPKPANTTEDEVEKLKTVVADQQKRIEQLEQMLGQHKALIEQVLHPPTPANSASDQTAATNPKDTNLAELNAPASVPIKKTTDDQSSPLSLHLGQASITPYGFLDLTAVIRDTNVGSGLGTNFGSIPFSNTVAGHLSEFRFSAQATRLGARFDAHHKGADFLGLVETDFVGNVPGNAAVSTNSDGLRIRLGWLDFRKRKWELMGGQSWTLLTPNRKGTSPVPSDIFATQNIDQSNQVGLTWGRQPQFRVIYHANRTVTFAVSLEAPSQYGGGSAGAGEITLPTALSSSYDPQINRGETSFSVPTLHPDVIAKLAFDPKVGRHDLHFEVAGLLTGFRFFNPQDQTKHHATGGGVLVGLNYEAFKNFRLIANGFYSNGGGRYIFGLAPDVIINSDGRPSLVHSASTVTGVEYQASATNLFNAYYGGAYIYRSSAIDTDGKFIGYGFPGSPLNHNRSLQQLTLGYTRTFWRDPNYGALQFITQYSYLVRNPWSVQVGQPASANVNFMYLTIRYVLPGAPPAKPGQ